jgi:hypothetical protein
VNKRVTGWVNNWVNKSVGWGWGLSDRKVCGRVMGMNEVSGWVAKRVTTGLSVVRVMLKDDDALTQGTERRPRRDGHCAEMKGNMASTSVQTEQKVAGGSRGWLWQALERVQEEQEVCADDDNYHAETRRSLPAQGSCNTNACSKTAHTWHHPPCASYPSLHTITAVCAIFIWKTIFK